MNAKLQLGRSDAAWLIVNAVTLGACIVLLVLRGPSGPVVLLTVGACGMLLGKIGKARCRPRQPCSSISETTRSES